MINTKIIRIEMPACAWTHVCMTLFSAVASTATILERTRLRTNRVTAFNSCFNARNIQAIASIYSGVIFQLQEDFDKTNENIKC